MHGMNRGMSYTVVLYVASIKQMVRPYFSSMSCCHLHWWATAGAPTRSTSSHKHTHMHNSNVMYYKFVLQLRMVFIKIVIAEFTFHHDVLNVLLSRRYVKFPKYLSISQIRLSVTTMLHCSCSQVVDRGCGRMGCTLYTLPKPVGFDGHLVDSREELWRATGCRCRLTPWLFAFLSTPAGAQWQLSVSAWSLSGRMVCKISGSPRSEILLSQICSALRRYVDGSWLFYH